MSTKPDRCPCGSVMSEEQVNCACGAVIMPVGNIVPVLFNTESTSDVPSSMRPSKIKISKGVEYKKGYSAGYKAGIRSITKPYKESK